eukprot:scaffold1607_cov93-Skeletonema_dohrnii-CCMP3373.AAC.3
MMRRKEGEIIGCALSPSADETSEGVSKTTAMVTNRTTTNPRAPIESNDGGCDQASSSQQQLARQLFQNEEYVLNEEYKNTFVFPSVPRPSGDTFRSAYHQAVSYGNQSHQYQLSRAGTNLLSLQEVILPSIYEETSELLKKMQAMAQRNVKDGMPDHQGKEVVEVIEACRKLLKRGTGKAMKDVGESCRQREQSRLERLAAEVEQRRADEKQAKQRRKEERALARQERKESARELAMRQDPDNIALHAELKVLEKELEELKKLETAWTEVKKDLDTKAQMPLSSEPMDVDPPVDGDNSMEEQVSNTPLEQITESTIEETTEAVNRLGDVFKTITSTMKRSEELHNEVSQYRFGEGELVMESARARRRRLQQEFQQGSSTSMDEDSMDESAQYEDNGNDMVEDESDATASIDHVDSALDQLSLRQENNEEDTSSSPPKTPVARRTRSHSRSSRQISSPLNGNELVVEDDSDTATSVDDVEGALNQLSMLQVNNEGGSSSSSSSITRRTPSRSHSRGPPTENNEEGSSSSMPMVEQRTRSRSHSESMSSPLITRSIGTRDGIASPALSPIGKMSTPIKVGDDSADITADTVDETMLEDDVSQIDILALDMDDGGVKMGPLSAVATDSSSSSSPSSNTSTPGIMVFNPSSKYDSHQPDSIESVLKNHGLAIDYLDSYPILNEVVTCFETNEINPSRERAQALADLEVASASASASTSVTNDASVDVGDGGADRFFVGNTINLSDGFDDLPQECAILGLRARYSVKYSKNPPTEGHAMFWSLLDRYVHSFESAKKSNTENTTSEVVEQLYNEYTAEYSFMRLTKLKNGHTLYRVEPSLPFIVDSRQGITTDFGSMRRTLYIQLNGHMKYLSNAENNYFQRKAEEKMAYFQQVRSNSTITLGHASADSFVLHSDLSDDERKNPNFDIDTYDSTLNQLLQTYPRPRPHPVNAEEIGANEHVSTLEVCILHAPLFEVILSLQDDPDNSATWKKVGELVAEEEAIPDHLKVLFGKPDDPKILKFAGLKLLDLLKILSKQCYFSGYKIAECGSAAHLATCELDHILKYYFKSHTPSQFFGKDTTGHTNPYTTRESEMLKRALYEGLKCRMVQSTYHYRGSGYFDRSQFDEGMSRSLQLTYKSQVDTVLNLFGGRDSVTFREFCKIEEFALLMLDWLSRGAFRFTKTPIVQYKALALAPMKLFHVVMPDMMKYTEAEYNDLEATTRVRHCVLAIKTLMVRLSGGCSRHIGRGCKVIRVEMNSWQLQGAMDWNHRDRDEKINCMSDSNLQRCPKRWHEEGTRGDCEGECKCCHREINAYQNGDGDCPRGYTGN